MTPYEKVAAELDTEFEKAKRRRRWIALHEDKTMFGLVPAEEAELRMLDAEFGVIHD